MRPPIFALIDCNNFYASCGCLVLISALSACSNVGVGADNRYGYPRGTAVITFPLDGKGKPPARLESNSTAVQEKRKPGEIDFETFRLLSTGMTEEEVLHMAGPPAQKYNGSCTLEQGVKGGSWQCWLYYYDSVWLVGVSFESRRVKKVTNIRLP